MAPAITEKPVVPADPMIVCSIRVGIECGDILLPNVRLQITMALTSLRPRAITNLIGLRRRYGKVHDADVHDADDGWIEELHGQLV